jgi:hypothetical protein
MATGFEKSGLSQISKFENGNWFGGLRKIFKFENGNRFGGLRKIFQN